MKISNTPNCRLCNIHEESILHLFCFCHKTQNLWESLITWINHTLNIQIKIDNFTIVLGYLLNNNYNVPFNTIISCTKSYIFKMAYYQGNLLLSELINKIKVIYNEQKSIATINNKLNYFNKNWNTWSNLF